MMELVVPTIRQGGASVAMVMVDPDDNSPLTTAKLNASSNYNRDDIGIQKCTRGTRAKSQIPHDVIPISGTYS